MGGNITNLISKWSMADLFSSLPFVPLVAILGLGGPSMAAKITRNHQ